jgi:hypothetical protein
LHSAVKFMRIMQKRAKCAVIRTSKNRILSALHKISGI